MQTRKETAWKKNRKFGDIKGGRRSLRFTDNIVARHHSIQRPAADCTLPIYKRDNPSRDFFFPLEIADIQRELSLLPQTDWETITHIWLRRFDKSDYESGELPLAEFCCGSGVRVIILYPWPKNLLWNHGSTKPSQSRQKTLATYNAPLSQQNADWVSDWHSARLKDFYLEYLLFHEIGHHLDWYTRHWSKANRKQTEEIANQYAYSRTTLRSVTFSDAENVKYHD